ncbi:MAG: hypothetical protein EBU90_20900 [Proteobacteria bacterium]|nr:hypothetical protein [Pseudomonadota bacterium]
MKTRYGGFKGYDVTPTQSSASGIWTLEEYIDANSNNSWPINPNFIQRSLRFNSADSAYLSRTFSASNRRTFTWSGWVKNSGSGGRMFDCFVDINNQDRLIWLSGGAILWASSISGTQRNVQSEALFRDYSAWYHIVLVIDTTQATDSNRVKIYSNGIEVIYASTPSYPTQNSDLNINRNFLHTISSYSGTAEFFSGYLAEINFIDGLALAPSLFGEIDPQTGVWIPKAYTGSYGTNGFRLNFSDNTSTTTLGYDTSGNGNNWTPNNLSVTPGSGNDSLVDVPSLYGVDTGLGGEVRGNYCTWNSLNKETNTTLTNGNLDVTAYNSAVFGTMGIYEGKWYWETTFIDPYNGGGPYNFYGVHGVTAASLSSYSSSSITNNLSTVIYANTDTSDGNTPGVFQLGTRIATYTVWATNDILGIAIDADNSKIAFYKNGRLLFSNVNITTIRPVLPAVALNGTSGDTGTCYTNFGQRPWAFTPPVGYKALCSTNLPAPAIGLASGNRASNFFNANTYVGTGSTLSITDIGFKPDLVWIKSRSGSGVNANHVITDSLRGVNSQLCSNTVSAPTTFTTSVTSFDSSGFTLGNEANVNTNTATYIAWCWRAESSNTTNTSGTISSVVRANQAAGFSIVNFIGNSTSGATVGHGLGQAPAMMILKSTTAGTGWAVYHKSLGATKYIWLMEQSAAATYSGAWNNTEPNSTVFTLGNDGQWNQTGRSQIVYCWAEIPGYSKFGGYTGNGGGADGTFIYLGFRPKFLLVKCSSNLSEWLLMDTTRNPYNPCNLRLDANQSISEQTVIYLDILSNGFKLKNTSSFMNDNGYTFIYAAFADSPFRQSIAR